MGRPSQRHRDADNRVRVQLGKKEHKGGYQHGLIEGILELADTGHQRYKRPVGDSYTLADHELPSNMWRYRYERDSAGPLAYPARRERALKLVERMFAEANAPKIERDTYSISVAWRLTREIARLKGLVSPEESLADAIEGYADTPSGLDRDGLDPWIHATGPVPWPPQGSKAQNAQARGASNLLRQAENLPKELQPVDYETQRVISVGFGLRPPEIRWKYLQEDPLLYSPREDEALVLWIRLLNEIARYLRLEAGTPDNPHAGYRGFGPLANPETAREAWPSVQQILFWESSMIEWTVDSLANTGSLRTKERLIRTHGLMSNETGSLIRLAHHSAREQTQMDIEDQRGIMVLRLEGAAGRARESLDIRAELAALKTLGIVQGLSRQDPEDAMTEFVKISRKYDDIDAREAQKALDIRIEKSLEDRNYR